MAIDIKLTKTTAGHFDINIASNGDFQLTSGLETAILMSILCEKRADKSEITKPIFRRGDWSNELNDISGYEVGSKFWLLYVARANQESINFGIDAINEGLKWMIEDKLIKDIETNGKVSTRGITFTINITQADNKVETFLIEAFEATGI